MTRGPFLRRPVSSAAEQAVDRLLAEARDVVLRAIAGRQRSALHVVIRTTDEYVSGKLTMRDGVSEARQLGVFPLTKPLDGRPRTG